MTIDAVGLALSRARSRPGLLAATLLTVVLATTFVTTAAMTLSAAGRGSVEASLARTDPAQRVVLISADRDQLSSVEDADAAVRGRLEEAFGSVPVAVTRRALSSSYQLPGRTDELPRLGVVATYEDLEDHARLVAGRWPENLTGTGQTLEVVLHQAAAAELGLEPGDQVRAVNRLDDEVLSLRVTGTVRPTDATGGYWAGDELGVTGTESGGSFVTFGPFFAAQAAEQQVADADAVWRGDPDLAGLEPDAVSDLGRSVAALLADGPEELEQGLGAATPVETDLDEVLDGLATPVEVARAAVALPLALVGLLALSALVLLARLLQADRSAVAGLQASRGFSARQLWAQNAAEALLATIPAVLLAPPLAWLAVTSVSELAGADEVSSAITLGPAAWGWSAACGAVVTVMLLRRGDAAETRGRARRAWSRIGLDLLVLPLAAVAAVRLITSRRSGVEPASLEDPFVVLAVPLVLLALALLVGRLVRLVLLLGADVAARSRGVVASVASWQLARRADEHRAMLVAAVLAGSVAAFGATHLDSSETSRSEQAALAVGADLRVTGLAGGSEGARTAAAIEQAGGAAMVVSRERTAVGDLPVDVLAVDPDVAQRVLSPTEDDSWASLLAPLGEEDESALSVVVDDTVGADAGETGAIRARVAGSDVAFRPTSQVADLPGVGPEADAVVGAVGVGRTTTGTGLLVDRAALAEVSQGLDSDAETEVWASAAREDLPAVREAVERVTAGGDAAAQAVTVQDRWTVADAQRDGPVGAGLRVGLVVGVVAAGLFGLIGFLAAAGAGLRQRRTEVASFRATGLSRRQVGTSLLGERTALLAVATIVGMGIGVSTAGVLLPRLVLTDAGELPSPSLALVVPWPVLGAAVAGVVVVSAALLAVMVAGLVARPVGDELRRGEDT